VRPQSYSRPAHLRAWRHVAALAGHLEPASTLKTLFGSLGFRRQASSPHFSRITAQPIPYVAILSPEPLVQHIQPTASEAL